MKMETKKYVVYHPGTNSYQDNNMFSPDFFTKEPDKINFFSSKERAIYGHNNLLQNNNQQIILIDAQGSRTIINKEELEVREIVQKLCLRGKVNEE